MTEFTAPPPLPFHLIDEETKARRAEITLLRSCCWLWLFEEAGTADTPLQILLALLSSL